MSGNLTLPGGLNPNESKELKETPSEDGYQVEDQWFKPAQIEGRCTALPLLRRGYSRNQIEVMEKQAGWRRA